MFRRSSKRWANSQSGVRDAYWDCFVLFPAGGAREHGRGKNVRSGPLRGGPNGLRHLERNLHAQLAGDLTRGAREEERR